MKKKDKKIVDEAETFALANRRKNWKKISF